VGIYGYATVSDESLSELSGCGLSVEERILPEQFRELLHGSAEPSGEHRLMLALLEDALHCWLRVGGFDTTLTTVKQERAHREADAWIFGGYLAPLSFEQVCGWLNLNPDYIRRELLKLSGTGSTNLPRYTRTRVRVAVGRSHGSRPAAKIERRRALQ
jgi:hypothetical protein